MRTKAVHNMVSAKINKASENTRLNKDGSVKKKAGRNAKLLNLSTVVRLEPETEVQDIPISLNDAHTSVVDGQMCQNEFRNEIMGELQQNIQNYVKQYLTPQNPQSSLLPRGDQSELNIASGENFHKKEDARPLSYRMKIDKFKGGEEEDYDVWWEDLQAFFALHSFNESEKIKLFNAHLGGEARKFLQNEDMEKLDSVEKLHELLRGTFSEKYDWQNVLMNIQQKSDEKVRPFSVRLRVAARKCGFQRSTLDNMCVNYLKRSCAPHLRTLLGNCLPGTPYDVIVEHAIQHERTKELDQAEKKRTKRKSEDLDVTETNEKNLEKNKTRLYKYDQST